MTRTLLAQSSLDRVVDARRHVHFALKIVDRRLAPAYILLGRNPYARVESFFREKLRRRPHEALELDSPKLKRQQTIFYPWLGVSREDPIPDQVAALLAMDFREFIELIPRVWRLDDHIAPQTFNFTRRFFGREIMMPFDQVVRIEDDAEMTRLAEKCSLDLTIHVNKTAPDAEVRWDPPLREVVRSVYRTDFEFFGYDTNWNDD